MKLKTVLIFFLLIFGSQSISAEIIKEHLPQATQIKKHEMIQKQSSISASVYKPLNQGIERQQLVFSDWKALIEAHVLVLTKDALLKK